MTKEQAKELVRKTFGDKAANDNDIVDFYLSVNEVAMEEYASQQAIGFLLWAFSHPEKSEYLYDEYLEHQKQNNQ